MQKELFGEIGAFIAWIKEVTWVALIDGFSKELSRKGLPVMSVCLCVCVWTIILQLSISFSMVISHRASPLLCSSLLCYSPLIIRMDSVSLLTSALLLSAFLRQKGVGEQSLARPPLLLYSLGFLSLPTPLPPSLLFHFPSSVKSLRSSPSWADCTVLQGSEGFPIFLFFSLSRPVPRRRRNKKGNYTSNKTCQIIGVSCSNTNLKK